MELCVKLVDISTGDAPVVLITHAAALTYDLHTSDRVLIQVNGKQVIAAVNLTNTGFGLRNDQVGMFLETASALEISESCGVRITPISKPESIKHIRKKMEGGELTADELREIVLDIISRRITQIELSFFVAGCKAYPLTFRETVDLTRAMSETGTQLHFAKKLVIDKHCIGGVPGNRTSMITVPILASLGYTVPKTSSRAITSPAGTADTMEVLAEVELPTERMRDVVNKIGGCLVWGGSVNLAPADDRIIKVERPLSLEVPGLMISSVLAKKLSAGSTHVVIDIPWGPGAKVESLVHAHELQRQFETIGKLLGMKMLIMITDGSQPIGYGIGPLLEAYDVLAVLKNDPTAPADLREKSLMLAGRLLEFIGHAKKGDGYRVAEEELVSGRAERKFQEIIDAQGRKVLPALAKYCYDLLSPISCTIKTIDNLCVTKIARIAGAPISQGAGLLLYAKVGDEVHAGDKLCSIYAESEEKLANAVAFVKTGSPYLLEP